MEVIIQQVIEFLRDYVSSSRSDILSPETAGYIIYLLEEGEECKEQLDKFRKIHLQDRKLKEECKSLKKYKNMWISLTNSISQYDRGGEIIDEMTDIEQKYLDKDGKE